MKKLRFLMTLTLIMIVSMPSIFASDTEITSQSIASTFAQENQNPCGCSCGCKACGCQNNSVKSEDAPVIIQNNKTQWCKKDRITPISFKKCCQYAGAAADCKICKKCKQ